MEQTRVKIDAVIVKLQLSSLVNFIFSFSVILYYDAYLKVHLSIWIKNVADEFF